jgi:hypothetical protein
MNERGHRGYSFPIARRLLRLASRARANWLERHQHPVSFAIHLVGIPLTLVGISLLFLTDWPWGVSCFVFGYFLQWVGHRIEGNDVGELIPLKRLLGLPVVAIAPQYRKDHPPGSVASPSSASE